MWLRPSCGRGTSPRPHDRAVAPRSEGDHRCVVCRAVKRRTPQADRTENGLLLPKALALPGAGMCSGTRLCRFVRCNAESDEASVPRSWQPVLANRRATHPVGGSNGGKALAMWSDRNCSTSTPPGRFVPPGCNRGTRVVGVSGNHPGRANRPGQRTGQWNVTVVFLVFDVPGTSAPDGRTAATSAHRAGMTSVPSSGAGSHHGMVRPARRRSSSMNPSVSAVTLELRTPSA